MPIVKTPRAVIDILDSEGKITNHEIEYNFAFDPAEGEEELAKMFAPRVMREEATPEQVAAFRESSDSSLTKSIQEVSLINADLQNQMTALKESSTKAVEEANNRADKAEAACKAMTEKLASAIQVLSA